MQTTFETKETQPDRLSEIQFLLNLQTDALQDRPRDELAALAQSLGKQLITYRDMTCDSVSAARFFGRKRSWIHEATSRPRTELQERLCEVVARTPGGLMFRLSDLARIRSDLFDHQGE